MLLRIIHGIFNKHDLTVFFDAIKKETPKEIATNGYNRIRDVIRMAYRSTFLDDILYNIDTADFFDDYIYVSGWIFSKSNEKFSTHLVLQDKKYPIEIGQLREDVYRFFPDYENSKYSHFEISCKEIIDNGQGFILVKSENGISQKIRINFKASKDIQSLPLNKQYQIFLSKNPINGVSHTDIQSDINSFSFNPLISIIMPVYNVDQKWLDKAIESVMIQYYTNWELCIYDDHSSNLETIECLKKWKIKDERIKISFGAKNLNISLASNEAINLATGEFIGLLDHDDELTKDALYEVVKLLNKNPKLDFIYSDEDKIDDVNKLSDPHFKSDFNLFMLRNQNYICHFSIIRRSIIEEIGGFRKGFEGAQDYDLILRVVDKTKSIAHIPKVLYHWRMIEGSTSQDFSSKSNVNSSALTAINDHLSRNSIKARTEIGDWNGTYKVNYHPVKNQLVSIIIPFKDDKDTLETCIDSIFTKTVYQHFEIILISNNSSEKDTFKYLEKLTAIHKNVTYHEINVPFNYSDINNRGVNLASGELILLLNNDTEVITKGWLRNMVGLIQQEKVGAVGAKLLYHDDTIQHAGVIIGLGGVAGHSHKHLQNLSPGYFFRPHIHQNLSACTAACLLIRKEVFIEVNGFDRENLKVAFNDVDLCLKLRENGFYIIYDALTILYHFESKSRGSDNSSKKRKRFVNEINFMKSKWKMPTQFEDEYYNSNLSLYTENFSLRIH